MNIKLLATTIAATALIGCGGSSSSSPTPTPEVTPTPTPAVTPTPTPTVTPTPTSETANQVARITDTDPLDTGELRYTIPGDDLLEGKVAVSFLKDDNVVDNNEDGSGKNAYITLYNSENSTSLGRSILDFIIGSSSFSIRDQDDIIVETPFTPGEWQDIEITWAAADLTSAATVTILIDNDTDNALTYTADARAIGGVSAVAFRFSDNDATVDPSLGYHVDDLMIYSDTTGTTSIFPDDFELYFVGDSLDTDNDASPYNSSTSEAVVAEKEK